MAARTVLTIPLDGVVVLGTSLVVLVLAVPVAAWVGSQGPVRFRRTALLSGLLLLVLLFGSVFVAKLVK